MTKDEQIEELLKQNRELMNKLQQPAQERTTRTHVEYRSQPRQESSLLDTVISGAAFGAGFSVVDNIVDSFFD